MDQYLGTLTPSALHGCSGHLSTPTGLKAYMLHKKKTPCNSSPLRFADCLGTSFAVPWISPSMEMPFPSHFKVCAQACDQPYKKSSCILC